MNKIEILKRMVHDPNYLKAWRIIEKVTRENKRHSVRAWLFCHQMIEKAEELILLHRGNKK